MCARMAMPYFGVKIYLVSLEMYGHTHTQVFKKSVTILPLTKCMPKY